MIDNLNQFGEMVIEQRYAGNEEMEEGICDTSYTRHVSIMIIKYEGNVDDAVFDVSICTTLCSLYLHVDKCEITCTW